MGSSNLPTQRVPALAGGAYPEELDLSRADFVIPDDVCRQHWAAQRSMQSRDEDREVRREEARRILEANTPEM